MTTTDPWGPLQSYRCNAFGHLCGGQAPPRTTAAELTDCHSAEDGRLYRVAEYATLFKGLKSDPALVFLAAIAAPPTPYVVQLSPAVLPQDPNQWPLIAHSCMATTGVYGDPAVRIADLVAAFGANGSLTSICGDFAPALTGIAAAVTRNMGTRCLQAAVVANPASGTPTLGAGCAVYESVPGAGGQRSERPLASCDQGVTSGQPCWSIGANPKCTAAGAELTVVRSDSPPTGAALVVRCP
jgi:hypothetical protein